MSLSWPDDFIDKVICGNCLEILPLIPDGAVDLVLTDPPYGIGIPRKSNNFGMRTDLSRRATADSWDDKPPTAEHFQQMFRTSRNQIVFGANYFWEHFYASQCYIVWNKRDGLPDVPFRPTEFAWTSFTDKMSKLYGLRMHGWIKGTADVPTGHPTQKPTELFVAILSDFSQPGDIILDPFFGVGTTGVAAEKLGRHFIGIEINPDYCKIAEQRLANLQPELPLEVTP